MQLGVDLAAPGAGHERDVVDQGTDGLGRLVALLWVSERLGRNCPGWATAGFGEKILSTEETGSDSSIG